MYQCQICKQYARKSLKEIVRHIRDVHRSFSTPVSCGVDDCPSTASSYESLRQHLYKKHRSALIPEAVNPEFNSEVVLEVTFPNTDHELPVLASESPASPDVHHLATAEPTRRPSSCELEAAKYILRVRDGKGLTQVVTDEIMRDVDTLINCATDSLRRKLTAKLDEMPQLSSSEIASLQAIFSPARSLFDGLDSICKQEAFFAENFNYVVCVHAYYVGCA